jgi:hypothetical protein
MNITYKIYPNEELLIEVVNGDITLDTLSAHFLRLESEVDFSKIKYLYCDHREAKFLFDNSFIKQISSGVLHLTQNHQLEKAVFLYQQCDENFLKTFQIFSKYREVNELKNIEFFMDHQIDQSFQYLNITNLKNIFNDFLQKKLYAA